MVYRLPYGLAKVLGKDLEIDMMFCKRWVCRDVDQYLDLPSRTLEKIKNNPQKAQTSKAKNKKSPEKQNQEYNLYFE